MFVLILWINECFCVYFFTIRQFVYLNKFRILAVNLNFTFSIAVNLLRLEHNYWVLVFGIFWGHTITELAAQIMHTANTTSKNFYFFYKKRTYYLSINSNHPVSELMRMYVKVNLGQKRHRSTASKETDHGPVLVHKLAVLGHTLKFPGFFTLW